MSITPAIVWNGEEMETPSLNEIEEMVCEGGPYLVMPQLIGAWKGGPMEHLINSYEMEDAARFSG